MRINWDLLNEIELSRGSVIPADVIERASGVSREDVKFGLVHTTIKEYIESRFERECGEIPFIRSERGSLVILTAEESCPYGKKMFARALKQAEEVNAKLRDVRADELSPEMRELLDRELIKQARILTAIRDAKKKSERRARLASTLDFG